jgi:2-polyprenyl-3-methyl-5-hydroxy-6-metoxy-1,4-benzoquinol methylase
MKTFNFIEYCIIDNNKYGLLLSRNKFKNYNNIVFLDHDVTQKVKSDLKYGFVLSIGVIEHFQDEILQKVIHNHCSFVERGGYLILSYPTPTIIYKSIRKILEISNNWLFFDEVPLLYNDISQFIPNNFTIIKRQTLWFNLLTQELLILKKNVS